MLPLTEDATTALLRALSDRAEMPLVFDEIRSRNWASVTFTGARHELSLRLEGGGADAAAERFCAGLEGAEFDLRGHILADIAAIARETMSPDSVRIRIEALTVEDA